MGSRGPAVVDDGGITLNPDPPSLLRHEAVVLGGHLSFHQHCQVNGKFTILGQTKPIFFVKFNPRSKLFYLNESNLIFFQK